MRLFPFCCLIGMMMIFATTLVSTDVSAQVALQHDSDSARVTITVAGAPFATYQYRDPEISRPYFAHVKAPHGIQVTRNHPPIEGVDRTDHPTYHPGIWMAFGDINGADSWRLKTPVHHGGFVEAPRIDEDGEVGRFAVVNHYMAAGPHALVCSELARYTIRAVEHGTLLTWDSTFFSPHEFRFGDQEELGLGVRVASAIRVSEGGSGKISDAEGNRNEKGVRGSTARWVSYSGPIDDHHAGIALLCHPDNFRPSWFHARDYGFFAANPFGREALGGGAKSSVPVPADGTLRLRYGVFVFATPTTEQVDVESVYRDYLRVATNRSP